MGSFYEKPQAYTVDGRGLADSYAYSTAKHLGDGQYYLITAKDEDGRALEGSHDYKLTVPANAPVQQYWSAVVYDRATHAPIRNAPRLAVRRSRKVCRPIVMARRTFTSGRTRRLARTRTGFRSAPAGDLKCYSASTGRTRPSSARRGSCRISRKSEGDPHEDTNGVTNNDGINRVDGGSRPCHRRQLQSRRVGHGHGVRHQGRRLQQVRSPSRVLRVDAPIVRPNRDTLYSLSVFDLDAGPVTITLPDAGQRFMTLQVIDGEQYSPEVHYGAGRYTFTSWPIRQTRKT